jgi:hypothetical protein
MTRKTLIVYLSRTGINSDVAHAMAEVLEAKYDMDVTIADLHDGQPDIAPFQNVIVGGGVDRSNVYPQAVDFLEKNFEGKNVALYFGCEDYENPKEQSTEDNSRKVLAKNKSLLPVSVAAFGGCMIKQGKPVMDELNMNRVKDWATELGKNFIALEPIPVVVEVIPAVEHAKTKGTEGIFEIISDSAGKFRFHLKAANGEIIAVSQSYEVKESAMTGIVSIKKNARIAKIADLTTTEGAMPKTTHAAGIIQDPVFEIQSNAPDKWRFHLKAANGEIIAVSQSYGTKESAENGIASVKQNAPKAKVVDLTTAATKT